MSEVEVGGFFKKPEGVFVPEEELKHIMSATEVERQWHEAAGSVDFKAREDIDAAEREGRVVRFPPKDETRIVENPKTKAIVRQAEYYEVTAPECRGSRELKLLWDGILDGYLKLCGERGLDPKGVRLRITSLARTTEYQQKLIREGYPAAEKSSHTKGEALDIYFEWLAENKPDHARALADVLGRMKAEERINVVMEHMNIGGKPHRVLHIARNPLKPAG
ncbi:MAG: hypothetical protein FJY77_04720 [Candidatus Altiarchaeales archaeon]|nr:hypothetical protein [Candidatus Altiarchaeales archaeon]